MEEHERQLVMEQLTASHGRLLQLVEGLSPEQWAFHPGEGRWSIGDCLEHVARVENRVMGLIEKHVAQPPEPEKRPLVAGKDDFVKSNLPDRTNRFQAPEAARPIGQFPDSKDLLAEFGKTRERTTRFAAGTQDDLRNHFFPHGRFGDLDCYQWLLLLGFHGERHAQQIEEIKADPAFPAMGTIS